MGVRNLEERVQALEKQVHSPQLEALEQKLEHLCDHCQSKVYLKELLNTEIAKYGELKYECDCNKDEIKKWKDYSKQLYKHVKKHGYKSQTH